MIRKRWEVVAVWPEGEVTSPDLRPRFWTARGARHFVSFAQEACEHRARARGVVAPRLEVRRRG